MKRLIFQYIQQPIFRQKSVNNISKVNTGSIWKVMTLFNNLQWPLARSCKSHFSYGNLPNSWKDYIPQKKEIIVFIHYQNNDLSFHMSRSYIVIRSGVSGKWKYHNLVLLKNNKSWSALLWSYINLHYIIFLSHTFTALHVYTSFNFKLSFWKEVKHFKLMCTCSFWCLRSSMLNNLVIPLKGQSTSKGFLARAPDASF